MNNNDFMLVHWLDHDADQFVARSVTSGGRSFINSSRIRVIADVGAVAFAAGFNFNMTAVRNICSAARNAARIHKYGAFRCLARFSDLSFIRFGIKQIYETIFLQSIATGSGGNSRIPVWNESACGQCIFDLAVAFAVRVRIFIS